MKDTADPQTAQEVRAFSKKYSETFNKHDASAQAALFTEDAVFVTPEGMVLGRQAIEKQYADIFQQLHPTNHIRTVDQRCMEGWRMELYSKKPGRSFAN